jgi:hypothetical protein
MSVTYNVSSGQLSSASGETTYQYNVNLTLGSDGVSGSILTDRNSGTLSQTDIVGWYLTYTIQENGGVASFPLGNSLGPAASGEHFLILGNDLTATPSGIYFDFTGATTSTWGAIFNGSGQFAWGKIPGSSDLSGFSLLGPQPGGGNPQVQNYFPESGVFQLATTTVGGTIAFAGAGGTLRTDATTSGAMPTNVISGFVPGDIIDLAGIGFDNSGTIKLKSGNQLEITENGNTYDLQLDPSQSFAGEQFKLSSDHSAGTDITVSPIFQGLGFAPGNAGSEA